MAAARVAVWDAPVRLFHWVLAALVVFSYVTGKVGGSWMEWHVRSGYCILSLLAFRLAWGLVGSDTARFARFLRGPRAALDYARATAHGRHPHAPGHNPLGGWMVVAMILILATQAASGLFADDEILTQGPLAAKVSNAVVARMGWIHEVNQWLVVGAVALHLAAIAAYQWGLKVDLIGPMIHGRAEFDSAIAPRLAPAARAAVLLAIAVALVYALVVVYPKA